MAQKNITGDLNVVGAIKHNGTEISYSGGGTTLHNVQFTHIDSAITISTFDGTSWSAAFSPQLNTDYPCIALQFVTGTNAGGATFSGTFLAFRSTTSYVGHVYFMGASITPVNFATWGTQEIGDVLMPLTDVSLDLID